MNDVIQRFLDNIAEIKAEKPTYRQPGDGSDGTCDCIGLIIGSVRRMGLKWTGIHGSNWAARKETTGLQKLTSASQLSVGDLVYKAKSPGDSGYALPDRYKQGKKYYTGDLLDYYHVGVVTKTSPLEITHMTTPTVRTDSTIKKWTHCGSLTMLLKASGQAIKQPTAPEPVPTEAEVKEIPASGKRAKVVANSGRYVKMRQQPNTRCRLYDEVPIGAIVTLEAPGESWAKISYGKRRNWYMMAKYLEVQS